MAKDSVRDALKNLLVKYPDLYLDPVRLERLLKDYLPEGHRLEIHLLIVAIEERVVKDLIAEKNTVPYEISVNKLTQKLMANCGLSAESASWAVEIWAHVLGVLATDDSWEEKSLPSDDSWDADHGSKVSSARTTTLAHGDHYIQNDQSASSVNAPVDSQPLPYTITGLPEIAGTQATASNASNIPPVDAKYAHNDIKSMDMKIIICGLLVLEGLFILTSGDVYYLSDALLLFLKIGIIVLFSGGIVSARDYINGHKNNNLAYKNNAPIIHAGILGALMGIFIVAIEIIKEYANGLNIHQLYPVLNLYDLDMIRAIFLFILFGLVAAIFTITGAVAYVIFDNNTINSSKNVRTGLGAFLYAIIIIVVYILL